MNFTEIVKMKNDDFLNDVNVPQKKERIMNSPESYNQLARFWEGIVKANDGIRSAKEQADDFDSKVARQLDEITNRLKPLINECIELHNQYKVNK